MAMGHGPMDYGATVFGGAVLAAICRVSGRGNKFAGGALWFLVRLGFLSSDASFCGLVGLLAPERASVSLREPNFLEILLHRLE